MQVLYLLHHIQDLTYLVYNEEMLEFIKEADHEFNNVETEINYANVVCGIIMENGTNVKQEKMLI